jgi:hypothetical protein
MKTTKQLLAEITDEMWQGYNNEELAYSYGFKVSTVQHFRRSRGKPQGPRKKGSGRPAVKQLDKFDLTKSNSENAITCDISLQYARVIRAKLEKWLSKSDFC